MSLRFRGPVHIIVKASVRVIGNAISLRSLSDACILYRGKDFSNELVVTQRS